MSKKKTTEQFIEDAKKIHGDKYNYSKVVYLGNKIKVKIICPIHDEFKQTPNDHLNKHGCPECARILTSEKFVWNKTNFIEEARKRYGDKYDYSLVEYKNSTTKVKIICPIHDVFEQTPASHLHSGGCKECGKAKKIIPDKELLKRLEKFPYYFSIEEKTGNRSCNFLIKGVCKNCGCETIKSYSNWINNLNFCKECSSNQSNGELKVQEFLKKHRISFEKQKKFKSLKDKSSLSYDFFLPSKNILIECQGEQHYKPKTFGGISKEKAYKNFLIQKHHDWLKRKFAENNGFILLEIPFKKYENIEEVLSVLTK